MRPKILLVQPPVYDFSAYDFWLKPYGLLSVAGLMRDRAELTFFDYLDRLHPAASVHARRRDRWGRGEFPSEIVPRPAEFGDIRRRFKRFGLPRSLFRRFLSGNSPCDFALIQTGMAYWYPGVREVIEDVQSMWPNTQIVLGGVYATLYPEHGKSLGADLVIEGNRLDPLWQATGIEPDLDQPPYWEAYTRLESGVIKLSDGCPFRCTYCAVPLHWPEFSVRPLRSAISGLSLLKSRGARHVAFYDDALLFRPGECLLPFLEKAQRMDSGVTFHTPNAINARLVTREVAQNMVKGGFGSFFIGLESRSAEWQQRTGNKVSETEFACAVATLRRAGAAPGTITAYLILGHPDDEVQELAESMETAHALGARIMLAEFSPVPGTPDGERAGNLVDLDEPLLGNKTAYVLSALGESWVNHLKQRCRELNSSLSKVH